MNECILDSIIPDPHPDFDRIQTVLLRNGIPDEVPFYELFFDETIMEAILGKKLPDRASTAEFYYRAGYDYVPAWPLLSLESGSLIDTSSHYPIEDWESFESYNWPSTGSVDYSEFETLAKVLPEGMKIIGQMSGIFEAAQSLMGYTGLCVSLYDDPGLVKAVFEKLGSLYKSVYSTMSEIYDVGAVVISDDMGFKTQTLLSADQIRSEVLPYHRMLSDIIHRNSKPCILHSCGYLEEVMDDIICDVKIDAKHSYEDIIMPVEDAYEKYSSRIAILGGFDLNMLCTANEEAIRQRTLRLMEKLGRSGAYALGSGNSIASYVPVGSFLAMIGAGWETRRWS